jgi:hypothetical protein
MKILGNRLNQGKPALITAGFFGRFQSARFQQRGAPSCIGRHAGAEVGLDLHLEVALELLGQFAVLAFLRE